MAKSGTVRLGPPVRAIVVAGGAATVLLALAVLVTFHGPALPGGAVEVDDRAISRAALLMSLIGQAIAAGSLAWVATLGVWRRPRIVMASVGAWGLVTSAAMLFGSHAWMYGSRHWWLALPLTAMLLAGVAVTLLVATSGERPNDGWRLAAAASAPFILVSVPVVLGGRFLITEAEPFAYGGLQPLLYAGDFVAGLAVLVLLGATIRVARDLSVHAVARYDAVRLLVGLLVAKILWIIVARVNAVTGWFPVIAEPWVLTNRAGVAEWVVAVGVALVVAVLLARGRSFGLDDHRITAAFVVVGVAFVSPLGINTLAYLGVTLTGTFFATGGAAFSFVVVVALAWWLRRRRVHRPGSRVRSAAVFVVMAFGLASAASARLLFVSPVPAVTGTVEGLLEFLILVDGAALMAFVALALGGVGAFLVRARETRVLGFLALAFASWSLPRVVEVLASVAGRAEVELLPRLLTFDTVLTVVVALGAVAWWRGWQQRVGPDVLLLALVLGTVATHAHAMPDPWRDHLFAVLVVAPIIYFVLLEARSMARGRNTRPGRLVAAVAFACVVLSLTLVLIDAGVMDPRTGGIIDLGPRLFAVPLAVVMLLASLRAPADGSQRLDVPFPLGAQPDVPGR